MSGFVELSDLVSLAQIGGRSYFQILVWPGGGTIGILLWLLSIVMVSLVVQAFIQVRRINIMPEDVHLRVKDMLDNKQYREAIEVTSQEPSMFSHLINAAMSEAPRGYAAMERALEEAADDRTVRILRGIEWLNLMGNVGPMIGLLGTVWGMILAFFKIVEMGGIPNAGMLADALGVKLVCTFVGLVVAIPSLAVYGIMRNRIDVLSNEALVNAQALIVSFRPGKKTEA